MNEPDSRRMTEAASTLHGEGGPGGATPPIWISGISLFDCSIREQIFTHAPVGRSHQGGGP